MNLDLQVLASELSDIIDEQVTKRVAPLLQRIADLEGAMKEEKGLAYRGVFTAGEIYDVGNMVTSGGSLWHCDQLTKDRPGDGNPAWTLAVKRGRDGKDLTRGAA